MMVFGIRLVGFNEVNGHKLLLTILFIAALFLVKYLAKFLISKIITDKNTAKVRFWSRQGVNLFFTFATVIVILSIWFDDPSRLATGFGLAVAGLSFALQKVITSLAGYLLIMRGNTFDVGDRITMGGIRGDVIELTFLQTTIMEMGQPPPVQEDEPAMWVKSRQFTGRIVTVTNDKVFEQPVFNYTKEFPFIWEEISLKIKYSADRDLAERILLESVKKHTDEIHRLSSTEWLQLQYKFGLTFSDTTPRVYYSLNSSWLNMSIRFLTKDHGTREVKDAINREILNRFNDAQLGFASDHFEIEIQNTPSES